MFGVLGGVCQLRFGWFIYRPSRFWLYCLAIWREWLHETKIEPVMMPKATLAHDLEPYRSTGTMNKAQIVKIKQILQSNT